MILQSLVRLAHQENLLEDPYVSQPVHWRVDVDAEGRILAVLPNFAQVEKKLNVNNAAIPKRRIRTVKIVPDLLIDKADYVFGFNAKFKQAEEGQAKTLKEAVKLAARFQSMLAETERIAQDTGSIAVRAQANAMSRVFERPELMTERWLPDQPRTEVHHASNRWLQVPKSWKSNHLFGFFYQDMPIWLESDVKEWVVTRGSHRALSKDKERCLISGLWCNTVMNHDPFDLPGDTGNLPMVSFNFRSVEHYGRAGNENAPIGPEAANACFMAMRRLLGLGDYIKEPRRNLRLTPNTTVLYWAEAEDGSDGTDDLNLDKFFGSDKEDQIQEVKEFYTAAGANGRPSPLKNSQMLMTLVLTREKSRVVLRTAEMRSISKVAASVMQFFHELEVCSRYRGDEKPYRGINRLLFGTVSSKVSKPQPNNDLATRLFACALDQNKPYPRELLATLIRRFRAHESVTRSRISLVKAFHNRNTKMKELNMSLEKDYPEPAYHIGRLFAVLEKIQKEAIDANTGIADRFLGAALATPALVFPRLFKLSHHHLRKLPERNSWNYRRTMDEIVDHIPPAFPATLLLQEQGCFMVGYHHQRADLWTSKTKNKEEK